MAQRIPYYDELLEAFGEAACPVCRVVAVSTDRLVDAVLFEMVNDVRVREELNAARGYCHRHAALFVRPGSALGAATMMQGVLKVLLRALEGHESGQVSGLRRLFRAGDPAAAGLAASLAPQVPCPLCAGEAVTLGHYLTTLRQYLTPGSELSSAYARSDGLCLPHFRQAAEGAGGETLEELVRVQKIVWERLNAELEEFLRKNDYRFSHEKMGAERDSWQRALSAISGPLPDHLTKS
jgi:hypothetical protein